MEKGTRHRDFYKGATPSVNDDDVAELCKRYPVKPGDNSNGSLQAIRGTNI